MDASTVLHGSAKSLPEKRRQKYLHFRIEPGDEGLLAELSQEQRALLESEGTYRQRADRFGIAIGTVRSRLHRARARLEELRGNRTKNGSDDTPSAH